MAQLVLKDSSHNLHTNCTIDFSFYPYLIFYLYVQIFDVMFLNKIGFFQCSAMWTRIGRLIVFFTHRSLRCAALSASIQPRLGRQDMPACLPGTNTLLQSCCQYEQWTAMNWTDQLMTVCFKRKNNVTFLWLNMNDKQKANLTRGLKTNQKQIPGTMPS
jgi:hypothetical protein